MRGLIVPCCAAVLLCSGCFSAAKRGLKEFRGATGEVVAVRECDRGFCASLGTIEIGSATNSIAPVCPPRVFTLVKAALAEEIAEASDDLDGDGLAVLDVDMCYYKGPGGVLAVAGKEGLLIGRAKVRDGSGREQGDFLVCVSSEAMRTSRREMAAVFARELVGYLKDEAED